MRDATSDDRTKSGTSTATRLTTLIAHFREYHGHAFVGAMAVGQRCQAKPVGWCGPGAATTGGDGATVFGGGTGLSL